MELIIDILKLVVPIVIALVSLAYAIKQRNVIKKEISKKRYLESALSNLNEVIRCLRKIDLPSILTIGEGYEVWGDTYTDVMCLMADVLKTSFDLKSKKISLHVSYAIRDYGEYSKETKEPRIIQNLDNFEPAWFVDFSYTHKYFIETEIDISNSWRFWRGNTLDFSLLRLGLYLLRQAHNRLITYEEVYEAVSPKTTSEMKRLLEDIAQETYKTIRTPRRVEVNLKDFSDTNGIMKYLLKEILDYSKIANKFSKVSELISELTDARRELFLKIS